MCSRERVLFIGRNNFIVFCPVCKCITCICSCSNRYSLSVFERACTTDCSAGNWVCICSDCVCDYFKVCNQSSVCSCCKRVFGIGRNNRTVFCPVNEVVACGRCRRNCNLSSFRECSSASNCAVGIVICQNCNVVAWYRTYCRQDIHRNVKATPRTGHRYPPSIVNFIVAVCVSATSCCREQSNITSCLRNIYTSKEIARNSHRSS